MGIAVLFVRFFGVPEAFINLMIQICKFILQIMIIIIIIVAQSGQRKEKGSYKAGTGLVPELP